MMIHSPGTPGSELFQPLAQALCFCCRRQSSSKTSQTDERRSQHGMRILLQVWRTHFEDMFSFSTHADIDRNSLTSIDMTRILTKVDMYDDVWSYLILYGHMWMYVLCMHMHTRWIYPKVGQLRLSQNTCAFLGKIMCVCIYVSFWSAWSPDASFLFSGKHHGPRFVWRRFWKSI